MNSFDKIFWPICAIALGAWETAAVTTRRVPTISVTCWDAKARHSKRTQAVVGLWLIALGAHLLKGPIRELT